MKKRLVVMSFSFASIFLAGSYHYSAENGSTRTDSYETRVMADTNSTHSLITSQQKDYSARFFQDGVNNQPGEVNSSELTDDNKSSVAKPDAINNINVNEEKAPAVVNTSTEIVKDTVYVETEIRKLIDSSHYHLSKGGIIGLFGVDYVELEGAMNGNKLWNFSIGAVEGYEYTLDGDAVDVEALMTDRVKFIIVFHFSDDADSVSYISGYYKDKYGVFHEYGVFPDGSFKDLSEHGSYLVNADGGIEQTGY
ncbi:hypothetical protein [Bacillus canaveralius]|uniref:hypothetical protein n=1 Tax=Bacillus canaveralius TaxID=1403243 RepID=UPI000F7B57CD|nr:hypothetical protein [Bacillus canaveralius]RSK49183.1 hypothetical protein EJA13_15710 [Bacillus canaveralius]